MAAVVSEQCRVASLERAGLTQIQHSEETADSVGVHQIVVVGCQPNSASVEEEYDGWLLRGPPLLHEWHFASPEALVFGLH